MTAVRQILLGVLVALVTMTSQSAAVARTMPGPDGQMVICTGSGPLMVYVDARRGVFCAGSMPAVPVWLSWRRSRVHVRRLLCS